MSELLKPEVILPLGLAIAILAVVIWVLYTQNKKLFEKLKSEKNRFSEYKQKLKKLYSSNFGYPQRDFNKLNKIVRNFFREYLNLNFNLTYLELEKRFRDQKKENYAVFCRQMSDINYSGEKIKPEKIKDLIKTFEKLLNSY